jgi:hypothetical protein
MPESYQDVGPKQPNWTTAQLARTALQVPEESQLLKHYCTTCVQ